jgi:hypothetical protein
MFCAGKIRVCCGLAAGKVNFWMATKTIVGEEWDFKNVLTRFLALRVG